MIDAALGTQHAIQLLSRIVPGFIDSFRNHANAYLDAKFKRDEFWLKARQQQTHIDLFTRELAASQHDYASKFLNLQNATPKLVVGAYQVCTVANLLHEFLFAGDYIASPLGIALSVKGSESKYRIEAVGSNAYPSATNHAYRVSRNAVLTVASYVQCLSIGGASLDDVTSHATDAGYWQLLRQQLQATKPIVASESPEKPSTVEEGFFEVAMIASNHSGQLYDYKNWQDTAKAYHAAGLEVAAVLSDFDTQDIDEHRQNAESRQPSGIAAASTKPAPKKDLATVLRSIEKLTDTLTKPRIKKRTDETAQELRNWEKIYREYENWLVPTVFKSKAIGKWTRKFEAFYENREDLKAWTIDAAWRKVEAARRRIERRSR